MQDLDFAFHVCDDLVVKLGEALKTNEASNTRSCDGLWLHVFHGWNPTEPIQRPPPIIPYKAAATMVKIGLWGREYNQCPAGMAHFRRRARPLMYMSISMTAPVPLALAYGFATSVVLRQIRQPSDSLEGWTQRPQRAWPASNMICIRGGG